jgi:ABC-type multidrug transport system ATPase subunit
VTPAAPVPILVEGVTARDRGEVACTGVTFSVPVGSIYVLLGRGPGPSALWRCLAGRIRPDSGRVLVLGVDPTRQWKLLGRRAVVAVGQDLGNRISRRRAPEVLLIDRPDAAAIAAAEPRLRELAAGATATLVATADAGVAGRIGGRIGIFARGRLAAEGELSDLLARFRRLRYANRITETRTAFGTELDEFDAVRVRVRGWGIEAVVGNFTPEAFDRLRTMDGVEDAAAEGMSLDEILEACAGT